MPARKRLQTEPTSRLAEQRIRRGVYQHELAQAAGVSLASLRRLERGEVKNAPLWWYVNCARALSVDLTEVVDDEQLRWRPTPRAPRQPGPEFLGDRYERAVEWQRELDGD